MQTNHEPNGKFAIHQYLYKREFILLFVISLSCLTLPLLYQSRERFWGFGKMQFSPLFLQTEKKELKNDRKRNFILGSVVSCSNLLQGNFPSFPPINHYPPPNCLQTQHQVEKARNSTNSSLNPLHLPNANRYLSLSYLFSGMALKTGFFPSSGGES